MSSVAPFDPIAHFMQFCNAPKPFNSVLESVRISMVSEIWRHRNNVIFKGGVVDHYEIFTHYKNFAIYIPIITYRLKSVCKLNITYGFESVSKVTLHTDFYKRILIRM